MGRKRSRWLGLSAAGVHCCSRRSRRTRSGHRYQQSPPPRSPERPTVSWGYPLEPPALPRVTGAIPKNREADDIIINIVKLSSIAHTSFVRQLHPLCQLLRGFDSRTALSAAIVACASSMERPYAFSSSSSCGVGSRDVTAWNLCTRSSRVCMYRPDATV